MVSNERILSKIEVDLTECNLELERLRAKEVSVDRMAYNISSMIEYYALIERIKTLGDYKEYIINC